MEKCIMSRVTEPAGEAEPLVPYRDLAGMPVHDVTDLLAGRVYGVLGEADSGIVRFLDVNLIDDGTHVLIPIGHARLEQAPDQTRIRLRAARLEDLQTVPRFNVEDGWPGESYARELASLHGRFFRGDHYYAHPAYEHGALFAGPHPIVMASQAGPPAPLLLLARSDYGVARGEPNVLGFSVIDAQGSKFGQVDDLVFDPAAQQVRYAVVRLGDGTRRLLPIGYLELQPESSLHLPGLTAADVSALPTFLGEPPTRVDEDGLRDRIERALDSRNPFLRVDFSGRQVVADH
jgi:PRC-barrel domain protein